MGFRKEFIKVVALLMEFVYQFVAMVLAVAIDVLLLVPALIASLICDYSLMFIFTRRFYGWLGEREEKRVRNVR